MTTLTDAIHHAIISTRIEAERPKAVLAAIDAAECVVIEAGRWERIKSDYVAAIVVACEKDKYLTNPGASVCQSDRDRWEAHAEQRWKEVYPDLDPSAEE